MKQYAWRKKAHGCSAQAAGELIESIEKRDGNVTARSFLEESRPEDSPTHSAFEWDDSVAAENYRLFQSRQIITDIAVKVVSDEPNEPTEKHVAFVNVTDGRHNVAQYKSVNVALADEVSRDIVLRNALSELEAFQRKYESLVELAELFDVINKLVDGEK